MLKKETNFRCKKHWNYILILDMQNLDFCYTSAVKTWFYRIEKFENHVKNQWKIYAESMLQKVGKSLSKWLPKWAKILQNIAPEATFGHWFCDFWPFGAMPKHHVFFSAFLEAQKTEKLAQDAAKGRLARHEPAPMTAFLRIWAPGRPCARGQWKVLKF